MCVWKRVICSDSQIASFTPPPELAPEAGVSDDGPGAPPGAAGSASPPVSSSSSSERLRLNSAMLSLAIFLALIGGLDLGLGEEYERRS